MSNWSGRVALVGAYEYPARKTPGVHPYEIQAECVVRALEDAGLTLADVDGFSTTAGDPPEGGGVLDTMEIAEWIGLRPTYVDSTETGGPAALSHVGHAAAAITTGMANVVVITYASVTYSYGSPLGSGYANTGATGAGQYELPYGITVAGSYALAAQRHMYEFGTTSEQLAEIAVACRMHAGSNPDARFRELITVEDVVGSPMIATPLHRLDCCVITDGGGAIVLTSEERLETVAGNRSRCLGSARPPGRCR